MACLARAGKVVGVAEMRCGGWQFIGHGGLHCKEGGVVNRFVARMASLVMLPMICVACVFLLP